MSSRKTERIPRGVPAVLLLALWMIGLAGMTGRGDAQEPQPEKPKTRESTYYDPFSHKAGPEGSTEPEGVDLEAAPRVSWTNSAGGLWSDAANWSGPAAPGEGDHAVIDLPGTYTVTLDADARIAGLTLGGAAGTQTLALPEYAIALRATGTIAPAGVLELAGGRITGDGDLVVHGTVVWSGGAMSGRGRLLVAEDGRVEITGADRKVLSLRHLESSGSLDWNGGGSLVLTFAAQIRNLEGGSFEVPSGAFLDIYGPSGPEVHNAGTMRVAVGGTAIFEPPLTNAGTLELAGGLRLEAGYTQTSDGVLRFDLGPTSAASDGGLQISGKATLAGTAELSWSPDGEPPGESLEVLTCSSREGDFSRWVGLTAPTGRQLEPHFEDGRLTLH